MTNQECYLLAYYLKTNQLANNFYNDFIKPLNIDFNVELDSDLNLAIIINGMKWCLLSHDNCIQILPHSSNLEKKIAHIEANNDVYDIENFRKGKKDNRYYIAANYAAIADHDAAIRKMLEHSLSFVKNIK